MTLGARAARLRFWPGLSAVVVLALVVRVLVVVGTPSFVPQTDASDYDRIAVSLSSDGVFPSSLLAPHSPTAFRPPLFPMLLAGADEVLGSDPSTRWIGGRLLEAVLGAGAVALISLIAVRLWGPGVALLAGAIAAASPPLILVGSSLMSESLFIPLVLGAVLAALVYRDSPGRWRWAILSGVLAGLATLTHGNGIMLVVALALLVLTGGSRRGWASLRAPAIIVAAAALTLAPWTIRNLHAFGQIDPVTTQTGYALAGVYNSQAAGATGSPALWHTPVAGMRAALHREPNLDEAQLSDRLRAMALHYIGSHPLYPLQVMFWSAARMLNLTGAGYELQNAAVEAYPRWLTRISVYAFWLLGLLAITGAIGEALAHRAPRALWACPLLVLLPSVLTLGDTRYRSPADPFLVILGALGALATARRIRTLAHVSG